tara:strand:- start:627 stop:866 length:240 start_codon:yes stop_codon:yes gene_type:complete
MKNTLKQKLIKKTLKLLKIKDANKLSKLKRKDHNEWDSLVHLQIIFLIEKNVKRKISINKLNKISKGKELIKIFDENLR